MEEGCLGVTASLTGTGLATDPASTMIGQLVAISPVDHPGGAETTLLRLLGGLRSRGWQIALASPGSGPMRDAALDAGYTWEPLPLGGLARGTGARAIGSWPRARKLAGRASVVYLNGAV